MGVVITGAIIIALAALFIFGKDTLGQLRVLLRGFTGLFVEDLSKTPEGAAAVYTDKINEAQNKYNIAHNTLQKVAGQLDSAKKSIVATKDKITKVEEKCEAFAKAGKDEELRLFAQQRLDLMEELELHERTQKELEPIFEEAKKISNHLERQLKQLKKDRVNVVNDLNLNKQLKEMYDDMEELKNLTNTDKLLSSIKEGVKDSREKAVGARVVHNNKLSTKISNADEQAKKLVNDDFVEQLKQKYKK